MDAEPKDVDLNNDMEIMVNSLISKLPMTQEKLAQMRSAIAQEKTLPMLGNVVKNGWPFHRNQLPASVAHYCLQNRSLFFLGQWFIIL